VPAGLSGDLVRDERGMRRCLTGERGGIATAREYPRRLRGELRTQLSQWRWLITAMNLCPYGGCVQLS
jgi:hypothetical protein